MIPVEMFQLSPEAEKFRTEWLAAWNASEERRTANDAEFQRLAAIEPEKFDSGCIQARQKWRLDAIDIAQQQIKLLQSYKETWPQMIDGERRRREMELMAEWDKAASAVVKSLTKIGYINVAVHSAIVSEHPSVAAVNERLMDLRSKFGNEGFTVNDLDSRIKRLNVSLQENLRNAA